MLIVFLAGYLRDKREVLAQGRLKDLGPLLLIWGAAMLVLVADERPRQRAAPLRDLPRDALRRDRPRARSSGAGLGALRRRRRGVYQSSTHVQERVTIWLAPVDGRAGLLRLDRRARAPPGLRLYQLVKSLYSIGNGGFGGTGPRQGHVHDDRRATRSSRTSTPTSSTRRSRRSSGSSARPALLLVFMLFVARGMRVALRADDGFSKLLAAGLTFGFALQTFIIVGGVLRVIPLTGITLPFVSYGGSSVVANFVLLAVLLLVSNRANAQAEGRVNRQITRLALARRRPDRGARRRDDLLADLGAGGLAERQDNPIQRVAQFTIKRGEIYATHGAALLARTGREEGRAGGRSTSALPDRRARRARRRLLDAGALAHRARAVAERLPDRRRTRTSRRSSTRTLDRLKGATIAGERPPADARHARAAGRACSALGGRCGAVVALEPDTGKVLVMASLADLRPEPDRGELRPRSTGIRRRLQARRAAAQPRHAGPLRARLDLQGRHRRGRARVAAATRRSRASTTPATARSTASASNNSDTDAARSGNVDLRQALAELGQLGLLQHRQGARRRRDRRQAKRFGFYDDAAARDARRTSARRAASTRAPSSSTRRIGHRRRPGPARLRPGAAARDAAADGDGRGDDRERRRPDAAAGRRPDRRAGRHDVVAHEAGRARPRGQAGRRPRRSRR